MSLCFNYRIVQRSRNLVPTWNFSDIMPKGEQRRREEGRVKEACSDLIPTDPRLLTPAQMFHSGRTIDLHCPNQTLVCPGGRDAGAQNVIFTAK